MQVSTDKPPSYSVIYPTRRKTAIVLLGNSGAGKSTLLTQLGAKTFKSGVRCRRGLTKDVYEEEVKINGQHVVLIDVPGLYEPTNKETQFNAEKLTEALKKNYDYKLYFVMKADNRGPPNSEMVMMFRINEWIKQANGARVSFRVIVNQILDDDTYKMYEEEVVIDKFKRFFKTLNDGKEIPGFLFDIKVDSVLLIRFDEAMAKNGGLMDTTTEFVSRHSPFGITMDRDLRASNEDITLFEATAKAFKWGSPAVILGGLTAGGMAAAEVGAASGLAAAAAAGGIALGGALAVGGLAVAAVGGSVWGVYKVGKMISRASGSER